MRKEKLIGKLIALECYRTKDRQLWELDELELAVLLVITIIKQLKETGIMKFEIKCKCGMNVAAELDRAEQENGNAAVLPIIATKDNGIQGVMVQTKEKEIQVTCTNCNESARFLLEPEERVEESPNLDWTNVSLIDQEGE
ncbi:hypothetical protein P9C03_28125 [Bacillus mycoides]|uniref:hypothetical protein n=1 Tax=Bacillus mycoides TaxID=1405 RepID=UPI002E009470|nr:hypothetical protein [Bacillus mycoides]